MHRRKTFHFLLFGQEEDMLPCKAYVRCMYMKPLSCNHLMMVRVYFSHTLLQCKWKISEFSYIEILKSQFLMALSGLGEAHNKVFNFTIITQLSNDSRQCVRVWIWRAPKRKYSRISKTWLYSKRKPLNWKMICHLISRTHVPI